MSGENEKMNRWRECDRKGEPH